MPSTKDPSVVTPGPGKLAAGQVPASAIAFPFGGAGDLAAHIADPVDAHMSGAIGVPEIDPVTGQPLLSSAGGPYDGESVLDALRSLADLLPTRPDRIGFNNVAVPNSGITNWGNPLTVGGSGVAKHGGYVNPFSQLQVTKYLVPSTAAGSPFTIGGVVYPADRGVLAVYEADYYNFFDDTQTVLVAALWLGPNPAPVGIPSANFTESTRTTGQTDYSPSNTGINRITLVDRLPYLSSYPGSEYTPFAANFTGYQLGKYSFSRTLVTGNNKSYLIIHWKETYATSLSAIQPANLTNLTFVDANCYSATPPPTPDPTGPYENVQRSQIYADTLHAAPPVPVFSQAAPVNNVSSIRVSGILFYMNSGLQFDVLSLCDDLFDNSFLTNESSSALVPSGYESDESILEVDTTDFGGVLDGVPLFNDSGTRIRKQSNNQVFSNVNVPNVGDQAQFAAWVPIGGTANGVPFPYGQVKLRWRRPFSLSPVIQTVPQRFLYNTLGNTLTTNTFEPFNDESYRYISSYGAAFNPGAILPGGGNVYNSNTLLASNDGNLQVLQGRLVYPGENFSAAPYNPTTTSGNYSAVRSGDTAFHKRRYVRAFNTGIARNTGVIRLRGLALAAFQVDAAYNGTEETGHINGGAIVQVRVPGPDGMGQYAWLDLGRPKGDPDLALNNFNGCATGVVVDGSDVYVSYDTSTFTSDVGGGGVFPIFVRVTFISNIAGWPLTLQEIAWLPTLP